MIYIEILHVAKGFIAATPRSIVYTFSKLEIAQHCDASNGTHFQLPASYAFQPALSADILAEGQLLLSMVSEVSASLVCTPLSLR